MVGLVIMFWPMLAVILPIAVFSKCIVWSLNTIKARRLRGGVNDYVVSDRLYSWYICMHVVFDDDWLDGLSDFNGDFDPVMVGLVIMFWTSSI